MKYLFRFARKYKLECICGPLFKLLEASFELMVPLVMKSIIDTGIAEKNVPYIVKMAVTLVLLGVFGLASTITAQYFSAKAAVGIVSKIKRALLTKIQALSYSDIDNIGTSSLITKMTSDANQVQSGINLTLRLFMRSPFVVFGAMIMAFTVDVKSAFTFVVVIPLLAAVVFGIMLSCIPLYKKVQSKLDSVLNSTRENLAGVRVIRAFSAESRESSEFDVKTEQLNREQTAVGRISALMNPITYILINFAVIALIYIGAVRVSGGHISQGAVVSLYNYMLLILVELIKLANLVITITKSVACEHRIEAVIDMVPSQKYAESAPEEIKGVPTVEFKNVMLRYNPTAEPALTDVSFTVFSGQTVGIIGGTGSGKTSLVNLIPRFYDATSGEVLLNGVNVNNYPAEALRGKIGIVPQKAVLLKGTVRENLLMGNDGATQTDISDALTASMSAEFIAKKENGLDSFVEQGGRNFSGGQRQRLTIARALVRKPSVLILDDSSSALDFATDAALRKALAALPYKPTVFIVSQRTSSIRYADKIIVLDDGAVAGIGAHEELLESSAVYREIHESQFKKEDRK